MPATFKRFRHRRVDATTRLAWRDTHLEPGCYIWPVFLVHGHDRCDPIAAMPEVYRYSVDRLCAELERLVPLGLQAVLLFGVPDTKGLEQAWATDGIVQTAIPVLKARFPALEIVTDVCLCSFTPDGHCHVGDNDTTIELLARVAASHAAAGADTVAPSDMMDGRVQAIRAAIPSSTRILSYAAKYAAAFYGPFRDAADCAPRQGDRKTYQMDPGHSTEALEEIAADLEEGADAVIVKPALAYLDIIARARARFDCPIVAYNVSGEYVMLRQGGPAMIEEALLAMRRAGADRIITYFAPELLGTTQSE